MRKRTLSLALCLCMVFSLLPIPSLAKDVTSGSYYEKAITWAAFNNIVTGYDSFTFKPDEPIKRQQIAAILYRYSRHKGYNLSAAASLIKYADVEIIDDYARTPMSWVETHNLMIDGMDGRHLYPLEFLPRKYAAAVLTRFCQNILPSGQQVKNTHTVTFDLNYEDGGIFKTVEVNDGNKVAQPQSPTRSRYSFLGWYVDQTASIRFNFNGAVTEDRTVYAKWGRTTSSSSSSRSSSSASSQESSTTYSVTFDSNGGSAVATQTVPSGSSATRPLSPVRTGYRFDGWYSNAFLTDDYNFSSPVTHNITIYAKWTLLTDTEESKNSEIYSKSLDEAHIVEGDLFYEGKTVSTMYVDNEILLEAKDGVTKEQIERLVGEYGGVIVGEIPIMEQYQIELRNASGLNRLNDVLSALSDNPLLESASPNTVMELEFNSDIFMPYYPTDPWEGESWNEGWPNGENWGLEAINVPSAWRMLLNRYGVSDDEAAVGDFSKINVTIQDQDAHGRLETANKIAWKGLTFCFLAVLA